MLVDWFGHGPSGARVESIEVEERDPAGETGFRVAG